MRSSTPKFHFYEKLFMLLIMGYILAVTIINMVFDWMGN